MAAFGRSTESEEILYKVQVCGTAVVGNSGVKSQARRGAGLAGMTLRSLSLLSGSRTTRRNAVSASCPLNRRDFNGN